MKLVTYRVSGPLGPLDKLGVLVEDKVIDLNMAYVAYLKEIEKEPKLYELALLRIPPGMIAFLEGEEKSREAAKKTLKYIQNHLEEGKPVAGPKGENVVYSKDKVKLLAPVPRPNTIRDFLCFEEHLKMGYEKMGLPVPRLWYELPVYYKGNPCTVAGPEETILWPSYEEELDYECELGIYIGKKGKDIPEERAAGYIAGFTIFNDVSARRREMAEMGLGLGPAKGKDFDTSNIMGPCIVTPDEIDFKDIKVVARINGQVQSRGYTKEMHWSWEKLIEYASQSETLYPGDFIGSGTIGRGCGIDVGRTLKPGDVIELEAEGIGVLRNKVGEKPPIKKVFTR